MNIRSYNILMEDMLYHRQIAKVMAEKHQIELKTEELNKEKYEIEQMKRFEYVKSTENDTNKGQKVDILA